MHVIGASGRGKSKALEHMIRQDIHKNHGVCLIDPHGTLYDDIVKWCAYHDMFRYRTIHLINPGGDDSTIGFNPLWVREGEEISRRVDRVVDAFAKVWGGEDTTSTPRLSKVLTCVFYALAYRNLTIVEASDLLSTSNVDGLREYLSTELGSPLFDRLWADFNDLPARTLHEYFESTDSRMVRFLASSTIRSMLGSNEHPIDFGKSMDNNEIVLIKLQESEKLSFANALVIGTLITNELFSLASERPEGLAERHPFYLYIDECYRFLTSDIEDMLNQTRKRGLHVTLVHHYLDQLRKESEAIYHAVMTNAQTKLIFGGLTDDDAEILAREVFRSEFDLDQVEETLNRPTATGEYSREILHSSQSARSEAGGSGTGSAVGASGGLSVAQHFSADGGEIGGYYETVSNVDVGSSSETSFSTEGTTTSEGWHEVLVPEYAIMPTALKSMDKVMHEAMVKLRTLGQQFAVLKRPTERSTYIKIPFVKNPIVTGRTVDAFITTTIEQSEYTLPQTQALKAIEERRLALVEMAKEDPDGDKELTEDDYLE